MSDSVECPHCNGTGMVGDDFLTDEHVREVVREYCDLFDVDYAYGVESYDSWGVNVHVKLDYTARGCYNSHTIELPRAYFTRNVENRRALMKADLAAKKQRDAERELAYKRQQLAQAEAQAARLRAELGS